MRRLSIKSVGLTAGIFLSITYVVCVVFDLLFPGLAIYQGSEIVITTVFEN